MKEVEKVCSAERLRDILTLTTHSMYDRFTNSINLGLAKQIAQKIYEINPTPEELGYVREADGLSLLHLSIFSHNPYLVALYMHLGANPDFHKFESGVTPRSLIFKTCHLVHGMRSAFFTPDNFLRDAGILKDFTEKTRSRFEIRVLNQEEEVGKEKQIVDAAPKILAGTEPYGLSLEEIESAARDLLSIFSSKEKRKINKPVEVEFSDKVLLTPCESSAICESVDI
ncbi:MAG: hypothetical protein AAF673_04430, partial [Pseudomonadota bacterium]